MLMPKECFWFSYGFTSYPPESELGIEQLYTGWPLTQYWKTLKKALTIIFP